MTSGVQTAAVAQADPGRGSAGQPTAEKQPTDVRRGTWSLRHRLRATFVVLSAALVVVIAVAAFASYRFVAAGNAVIYRWQRAAATSSALLADLVNQETGLRGFELTRDEASLQPFEQYRARERVDLHALRGFVRGEPALADKVEAVSVSAARWQREVAQPAIAEARRGGSAVLATQLAAKARFDVIRTDTAELMNALERRAVDERSMRTTWGLVTAVLAGLAVLTIVVLGAVLWRGLGRWVLAPMLRLGTQTRQVSSGATHQQIVPDGPVELTALGDDVEAMRLQIAGQLAEAERIQDELRIRGEELVRSNEDLQQFAYVASHDLSEPLRKVANFCQLLERQYAPQLDDRARQYIDFAVDGAKRMQVLITDLLALSRVGRTTEKFEAVDLDQRLDLALRNLDDRVESAGATIERLTPLPTVSGDRSLLGSLLENLVGNAVKYRRADVPPVVRISAELDAGRRRWTITVRDNGIGIDPQYAERIFAAFQRLHLRDQYGGTGIGLALCRKIVEFHGGRIWLGDVESATQGATFRFTLPER